MKAFLIEFVKLQIELIYNEIDEIGGNEENDDVQKAVSGYEESDKGDDNQSLTMPISCSKGQVDE